MNAIDDENQEQQITSTQGEDDNVEYEHWLDFCVKTFWATLLAFNVLTKELILAS